jgi:hypothetical protein
MTHDEWISDLNKYIAVAEIATPATAQLVKALRAVVELHFPTDNGIWCELCIASNFEYPCPTIQAIEKELS